VVNMSIVQKLASRTELRLDILNIGDNTFEIRDGSVATFGSQQPWGSIGASGVRDKARQWMGAGVSRGGTSPLR
jgi:hypothetical protein